jgi:SAM-dependent methyltransferase
VSSAPAVEPIEREGFYRRVVGELLEEKLVRRDMAVVVVGGGELDRRVLAGHGFENVTLSNLDPDKGDVEDAEALSYADGSFDFGIVSAALHHCRSPHGALLELYRVARVGVLALEARDSALMRLANRIGVAEEYELTVVAAEGFRTGGVANSAVPNYVFRWTEREVEKTIRSAAPERRHRFVWFRELELPVSVLEQSGKSAWRFARLPLRALVAVLPKQANLFAFAVLKGDLQPWMRTESDPDAEEIRRRLGG